MGEVLPSDAITPPRLTRLLRTHSLLGIRLLRTPDGASQRLRLGQNGARQRRPIGARHEEAFDVRVRDDTVLVAVQHVEGCTEQTDVAGRRRRGRRRSDELVLVYCAVA